MRARITSVQVSILETNQLRAEQLQQEIDRINDEICQLLAIEPDDSVVEEQRVEHIRRFLNGWCTAPVLLDRLGIEVQG